MSHSFTTPEVSVRWEDGMYQTIISLR